MMVFFKKNKISLYDLSIALMILALVFIGDYFFLCVATQIFALFMTFCYHVGKKMSSHGFLFVLWGLLFFLISISSLLWASPKNVSVIQNSIAIAQAIVIGTSIVFYVNDSNRLDFVIFIFIISSFLFAIRFLLTVPTSWWGQQERFENETAFGKNSNAVALSFSALLLLTWGKRKIGFFLKCVPSLIMLFVSILMGTKSGIIIFLFGYAVYCLLAVKSPVTFLRNTFLIIVMFIAVYYLIMNVDVLYYSVGYRIESLINGLLGYDTDKSTSTRLAFIPEAIKVFVKNPIFGIGLDGFRYVNPIQKSFAHNNYIELLADLGIVGFVSYYSLVFVSVLKGMRIKAKNSIPLMMLLCLLLIDFTTVSYSMEINYFFFAAFYSYLSCMSKFEKCISKIKLADAFSLTTNRV